MIVIGEIALWMAMLFAAWSVVAGAVAGATDREELASSGARGLVAAGAMLLLAAVGVATALVRRDYGMAYAAATSSRDLPTPYAIAGLWAAPAGAALLLGAPLAVGGGVTTLGRHGRVMPWTIAFLALVLLAIVAPLGMSNVLYARLAWAPADGVGLLPSLQSPFMLAGPPLLASGYALALPHAAALLGTLVPRSDDASLRAGARRLAILGWVLLGVGILVVMCWAYHDPVWEARWPLRGLRDGSLLAWIVLALLLATTSPRAMRSLRLPATLAVLSGAAVATAAMVAPLGVVESVLALLATNAGRAGAVVVVAAAAGAWLAARAVPFQRMEAAGAGARWARRAGGIVLLVGVALVGLALSGHARRAEHRVTLRDGVATEVVDPAGARWRVVSQGISRYRARDRDVRALAIELTREGGSAGLVTSERWQPVDRAGRLRGEPVTEAGVRTTPRTDVWLTLDDAREGEADVRIAFVPLALWAWVGGFLVLAGGVLLLWE